MGKMHNKTRDEVLQHGAVEFMNDMAYIKDRRKKISMDMRTMKSAEAMMVYLLNEMI